MMTQEHLPIIFDGLEKYQGKRDEHSVAWLKNFRRSAWQSFINSTIPTIKDEEWMYTSLGDMTSKRWHLPLQHILREEQELADFLNGDDINIVLVNGVLVKELSHLSRLPKGITIKSFNDATVSHGPLIESMVSKLTPNDTKAFVYLNNALFLDGVFINVDDKAVIEPLIHIVHVTSGVDPDAFVMPRSCIHVGQAADVSILETHISFDNGAYASNPLTDMRIGQDARVQYCKAQGESPQAIHVGTTRIWQDKGSQLDSFSFMNGALVTRNNLSILLKGEGTNTIMNGFYALEGRQHVDNHTLLDIQQPNCTSYQLYKGILNEQSRVVFNGKIYVHSIAQKTNGYQLNKHLLLGKDARIDTKPQLEIFADDVKCTHGATIGQISEEEVFYLQSRCIPQSTARQLLARGFMDESINTIKSASVRAKINYILNQKFPEVVL